MTVIRSPETCSALLFRLALRRYAIPLQRTSGVQDLSVVRKIPNSPRRWFGLTEWSGRVLNVVDLPHLLGDRAVESAKSIVRLREPHADMALYIPAHLGLTELGTPEPAAANASYVALGSAPDALHWIDLDAIVAECARQAAS
jgi:chemotaxis signal transduction protein